MVMRHYRPKKITVRASQYDGTAQSASKIIDQITDLARNNMRLQRFISNYGLPTLIEASTDYEALVKNSRKKFNDFDIVALQAMRDDEYSYYASHFVSQYKTATGRDDYHDMDAKRRLRRMQRMGLVRLARGLFDEDGFTAGSGWTREYSKNSIIERIIENYTAKNKQLSLADL